MKTKITNTVKCKSCGADIFFIKTKMGKWHPLDAGIIISDGKKLLFGGKLCGFKKLEAGRKGFISHFATCPEANKFRKEKK